MELCHALVRFSSEYSPIASKNKEE